jgi:hypothetical protein
MAGSVKSRSRATMGPGPPAQAVHARRCRAPAALCVQLGQLSRPWPRGYRASPAMHSCPFPPRMERGKVAPRTRKASAARTTAGLGEPMRCSRAQLERATRSRALERSEQRQARGLGSARRSEGRAAPPAGAQA